MFVFLDHDCKSGVGVGGGGGGCDVVVKHRTQKREMRCVFLIIYGNKILN